MKEFTENGFRYFFASPSKAGQVTDITKTVTTRICKEHRDDKCPICYRKSEYIFSCNQCRGRKRACVRCQAKARKFLYLEFEKSKRTITTYGTIVIPPTPHDEAFICAVSEEVPV